MIRELLLLIPGGLLQGNHNSPSTWQKGEEDTDMLMNTRRLV
jgi:hypothetical protein